MKEDAAAERAPICPACGYDLRGTPLGRCPECGSPFETIRVFGDADALIKARWQALQNGTYASLLCALSVPLIYLAPFPPFCFLWVVPPVLLVYLVTTVARAALWRWSSHGKRILAAGHPRTSL